MSRYVYPLDGPDLRTDWESLGSLGQLHGLKVFKKIGKKLKKIAKSKVFRYAAIAAATYFGAGAIAGKFGGAGKMAGGFGKVAKGIGTVVKEAAPILLARGQAQGMDPMAGSADYAAEYGDYYDPRQDAYYMQDAPGRTAAAARVRAASAGGLFSGKNLILMAAAGATIFLATRARGGRRRRR